MQDWEIPNQRLTVSVLLVRAMLGVTSCSSPMFNQKPRNFAMRPNRPTDH